MEVYLVFISGVRSTDYGVGSVRAGDVWRVEVGGKLQDQ